MNHPPEKSYQIQFLEQLEKYGYVTAGLSFLLVGMMVFVNAWYQFINGLPRGLSFAALHLMNELLLVVILLELFRTVINFLKSRMISLEPFLYVGIIASVRRLLTIGAEMTLHVDIAPDRFRLYLFDALVNVAIVLTLMGSLALYRTRIPPPEQNPDKP